MGWAEKFIARLEKGESVQFRPRGTSMAGKIDSGALVTVEPVTATTALQVGDVVLCVVGGAEYLHLIQDIRDGSFLIGNNKGRINGWIPRTRIYGRCVEVAK